MVLCNLVSILSEIIKVKIFFEISHILYCSLFWCDTIVSLLLHSLRIIEDRIFEFSIWYLKLFVSSWERDIKLEIARKIRGEIYRIVVLIDDSVLLKYCFKTYVARSIDFTGEFVDIKIFFCKYSFAYASKISFFNIICYSWFEIIIIFFSKYRGKIFEIKNCLRCFKYFYHTL